ncbi:MAG: caspase family protein, partial [Burkholderiales bacterium]
MKRKAAFRSAAMSSARREAIVKLLAMAGAGALPSIPNALWAQAIAQSASDAATQTRRALVLGNTAYSPDRHSIPSSRKNANDVGSTLNHLGFEVRREVDQGVQAMRSLLQEFFSQLRSDPSRRAFGVFYYTGHGMQHLGENYVVPSDVDLQQGVEAIVKASINVDREIIGQASLPNDGTAVLIFDACRNDPSKGRQDRGGSFNQVNPPRGTVITYSTAAGKYAIAPKSADANSIYTEILVDELKKANASINVKDFLDAVKFRVRQFMETSPEQFLRTHAQDPEVAANLPLRLTFALQKVPARVRDEEQEAWKRIDGTLAPAERIKLLNEFIEKFKDSRFLQAAQVQLERATISEASTQKNPVQIETAIGNAEFRSDQAKALDGDKDAAYRVAQMFERGSNGAPRDERKMVQWLRHASELKNGIASYQLYQYYLSRKLDRQAVQYENRAREQGYEPPPRL